MNFYGTDIPERFLKSSHRTKSFIDRLKEVKFEYDAAEYSLKILVSEAEHLRAAHLEVTRTILLKMTASNRLHKFALTRLRLLFCSN